MKFSDGHPKRIKRKPRKLNRQQVLDLHAKGLSTGQIAQHQRVAPSTVWRFLQHTEPERQALEQFKTQRGDVLARLQAKSLDAQERIIDSLDDGVVNAATPSQKSGMLIALNAQAGTLYDKERLETGKSTANHTILSRLVDETMRELYNPQAIDKKENAKSKVVATERRCATMRRRWLSGANRSH